MENPSSPPHGHTHGGTHPKHPPCTQIPLPKFFPIGEGPVKTLHNPSPGLSFEGTPFPSPHKSPHGVNPPKHPPRVPISIPKLIFPWTNPVSPLPNPHRWAPKRAHNPNLPPKMGPCSLKAQPKPHVVAGPARGGNFIHEDTADGQREQMCLHPCSEKVHEVRAHDSSSGSDTGSSLTEHESPGNLSEEPCRNTGNPIHPREDRGRLTAGGSAGWVHEYRAQQDRNQRTTKEHFKPQQFPPLLLNPFKSFYCEDTCPGRGGTIHVETYCSMQDADSVLSWNSDVDETSAQTHDMDPAGETGMRAPLISDESRIVTESECLEICNMLNQATSVTSSNLNAQDPWLTGDPWNSDIPANPGVAYGIRAVLKEQHGLRRFPRSHGNGHRPAFETQGSSTLGYEGQASGSGPWGGYTGLTTIPRDLLERQDRGGKPQTTVSPPIISIPPSFQFPPSFQSPPEFQPHEQDRLESSQLPRAFPRPLFQQALPPLAPEPWQ